MYVFMLFAFKPLPVSHGWMVCAISSSIVYIIHIWAWSHVVLDYCWSTMVINEIARLSIHEVWWFQEQTTDDSSTKALTMYNNSYPKSPIWVENQRPTQKWFIITLELTSHGIINNMESSGWDSYLRHGCECIHHVVLLRLFGSRSQSVDWIHHKLTVQ